MRRSGSRPAVKRWKLCLRDVAACGVGPHRGDAIVEIRRRLADRGRGHQRMAGGAVLAAPGRRRAVAGARMASAAALAVGLGPEKMLPNRFESPPPDDCAAASPDSSSAAATTAAPVRFAIDGPVRRHVSALPKHPAFRRPCHGFQQLNKGEILFLALGDEWTHHTSAFVPGCKPATNVQSNALFRSSQGLPTSP